MGLLLTRAEQKAEAAYAALIDRFDAEAARGLFVEAAGLFREAAEGDGGDGKPAAA